MEKLQIQNMGLPQYPIIFYTEHCVYISDNRALPQVLTCGNRIVTGHAMTTLKQQIENTNYKHKADTIKNNQGL